MSNFYEYFIQINNSWVIKYLQLAYFLLWYTRIQELRKKPMTIQTLTIWLEEMRMSLEPKEFINENKQTKKNPYTVAGEKLRNFHRNIFFSTTQSPQRIQTVEDVFFVFFF